MKKPTQPIAQPSALALQNVQQLFQSGRLPEAEAQVRALLASYPKAVALYNLLAMCQQRQGRLRDAATSFRQLLAIDPRIAEVHCNLGAINTQLNDRKAAIACYRKALQIKPTLTIAHFNLGALLQAQGQWQEAAHHYQQAVAQEPGFFEAQANLGTIMHERGQLAAAEQCYRKALALRPDARGHFNLGTALYDQGEHADALKEFRLAVQLDPHFAQAWNSLGETLRDQGIMDEAVRCYETALQTDPAMHRARYNLAEFYCLAGRLLDAIPLFQAADFADASERALQCLYKTGQFAEFKRQFSALAGRGRASSVLLGALSSHYALNFRETNAYGFCDEPMAYVQHSRIEALAEPDSPLLGALLRDIQTLAIAERKQGRLYYGMQSAGNLLQREEPSIQQLAALIRAKIQAYQKEFSASRAELIVGFPREVAFASSWYLRMKQGGYLTSHIHEEGWLSGCVYLQVPDKRNQHEGSFEYGLDGDDYPKLHDEFPSRVVDQQVGDLVLFPSSVFHRSIPFQADQERVCVAFDVKPAVLG